MVAVLVLTERPRAVLAQRRAVQAGTSPWQAAADTRDEQPGRGLMSGFFEMPAALPEQRPAPSNARPAGTR